MSIEIPLETMSVAEKIRLLESVWNSLCCEPGYMQSPEWHREILENRKQRLEDSQATVSPWREAKERLLNEGQ